MSESQKTSEATLMENISKFCHAGGAVIHVRSREPQRAMLALRKNLVATQDVAVTEWDVTNGFRMFTTENYSDLLKPGMNPSNPEDFFTALSEPLRQYRTSTSAVNAHPEQIHYFIYLDPHPFIKDNPMAAALIHQYAAALVATNICMIFVTPEVTIPDIAPGTLLVTDMPTPTHIELREMAENAMSDVMDTSASYFPDGHDLTDADFDTIANLGLGLTAFEFETHMSLSIIAAQNDKSKSVGMSYLTEGISAGKTEVIKQSEILTLLRPQGIEAVAGMSALKAWLLKRAGCYSEEAREFGIETPKGMVLVGVPGTGKSLVAKVTASSLGLPLVRLDMGAVFSKYVGDSESRMRNALKMIEGMAPCVVFIDEIDKGLGGTGGASGDGGIATRVLGIYLTWLQECKAPVFNVVTANRVAGLPPELLRQGRFDKIWSLGLPNRLDRREALQVHLSLRDRDISMFKEADLAEFDANSENYVPAEIEAAVKDALILAFHDKSKDVKMSHIVAALRNMVPMSKSNKAAIDAILEWAANNATPVSGDEASASLDRPATGQRLLRRMRNAPNSQE